MYGNPRVKNSLNKKNPSFDGFKFICLALPALPA